MAQLAQARSGTQVLVRQRPVPFSFWPMQRGSRRFGLQSSLFVRDPWTVIKDAVQSRCPSLAKAEALACLEQAQDFYTSALSASLAAARPLQLYYCFLNLAKAFALTSAMATTFDRAQHGLSERLDSGGRELFNAYLQVSPSGGGGPRQIFAESISARLLTHIPDASQMPAITPKLAVTGLSLWAPGLVAHGVRDGRRVSLPRLLTHRRRHRSRPAFRSAAAYSWHPALRFLVGWPSDAVRLSVLGHESAPVAVTARTRLSGSVATAMTTAPELHLPSLRWTRTNSQLDSGQEPQPVRSRPASPAAKAGTAKPRPQPGRSRRGPRRAWPPQGRTPLPEAWRCVADHPSKPRARSQRARGTRRLLARRCRRQSPGPEEARSRSPPSPQRQSRSRGEPRESLPGARAHDRPPWPRKAPWSRARYRVGPTAHWARTRAEA
jgi:YaaC-like Protein